MTSFIAAGGSGRSTSVIPAVPAASSVTTIAFMGIVSSLIRLFSGSRTNADDRLPADPLGRVEGCNGIVEGRDVADVHPQQSVPHPLDDLTQLGRIGSTPVRAPRRRRKLGMSALVTQRFARTVGASLRERREQ